MIVRYVKITMTLAVAAFALLVAYNNISDYDSNFAFVQHVLSMDSVFPGNTATDRALTLPLLWNVGYWLIITGEALTGILLVVGALRLWLARHGVASYFNRRKGWAIAGFCLGFCVWFFGFMVVGGEWFMMWQSQTWNGQDAAFKFYMAILGVLIFLNQPDAELH